MQTGLSSSLHLYPEVKCFWMQQLQVLHKVGSFRWIFINEGQNVGSDSSEASTLPPQLSCYVDGHEKNI